MTPLQHDHPIGEREGLQRIVRHQQPHAAERCQVPAQVAAQLRSSLHVDRREGLVEQQHAGLDGERARQRHALPLPTRERAGSCAGPVAEAHALEPRARDPARLRARPPVTAQAERDVVESRHVRKEQLVLEHDGDGPLLRRHGDALRRILEHHAVQGESPLLDRDEPRQRVQQRGLAAAVRPQDGRRLAGGDRELDVELEGAPVEAGARLEAHGASSQRPRMMTRMVSDTARSTRLSAMPASGRLSSST